MNNRTRIWIGLCLLAVLLLALGGTALAAGGHPTPTFTINGKSSGTVTGQVNQHLPLVLDAPDMTAARILWTNQEGEEDGWVVNDMFSWEWNEWWKALCRVDFSAFEFDWAGTYTVRAQVCYDAIGEDPDWEGLNWVNAGNQITVTTTTSGAALAAPKVTVQNASNIHRGDLAVLKVTNAASLLEQPYFNMFCSIGYYNEDGNLDLAHSDWSGGIEGDTIYMDTTELDPGTYDYNVGYCYQGREWVNTQGTITVKAPSADVVLNFNKTEVDPYEFFLYSIYAPDAERVQLFRSEDEEWEGRDGERMVVNDWWESGEYDVFGRAFYSDGTTKDSATVHITVHDGDYLAPSTVSNLPTTINAGEDLTFTVDEIEGADSYDIHLMDTSGEHEIVAWFEQPAGEFTIPAAFMEPNTLYRVRIVALAYGANPGWMDPDQFVFVKDDSASQSNITLTVDAPNEVWANDTNVHIHIEAPGATLVRLYSNYDTDWDLGDQADFDWEFNDPGNQMLWAKACYNEQWADKQREDLDDVDLDYDIDWDDSISNVVILNVRSNGLTEIPAISAPASVTQGQWLPVTIDDSPRIERYHLRIKTGNDEDELYFNEVFAPGTYNLPTSLEPGRYRITLDGTNAGWTFNRGEDIFVDITAPGQDKPYFIVSKNHVQFNERFNLQAHYPGAEQIRIVYMNDFDAEWGTWDGEYAFNDGNWEWAMDEGWGDDQTLDAYAMVGGEWQDAPFASVNMIVDEPEELARPTIQVSSTVRADQDFTITIPKVPHANYYNVHIHKPYADQEYEDDSGYVEYAQGESVTFTVPANTLDADEIYWIDVDVNAEEPGYAGNSADRSILVASGSTDSKITLSVSDTEVYINTPFHVDAHADGANAMLIRYGDQYHYREGDTVDDDFEEWQDTDEVLYAQACYDTRLRNIDWGEVDWDQFSWEDYTWSAPSKKTYNMHFIALGTCGEPEIDAPDTVHRGDDLVVSINDPGAHAVENHANIQSNRPGEDENWYDEDWESWDEDDRTITLSTASLEPGTYYLAVDNWAPGYHGNRTWHQFEVLEPTAPIVFNISPSGQPAVLDFPDEFNVNIVATGAVHLDFTLNSFDGSEFYMHLWEGDSDHLHGRWHFHPGEYGLRVTATYPDGSSKTSDLIQVQTVENHDKTLRLPASLKVIEEEAFENIDAQFVVIPSGVTTIEARAFADCEWLLEVQIPASVTFIDDSAFDGPSHDFLVLDGNSNYVRQYAEDHGIQYK